MRSQSSVSTKCRLTLRIQWKIHSKCFNYQFYEPFHRLPQSPNHRVINHRWECLEEHLSTIQCARCAVGRFECLESLCQKSKQKNFNPRISKSLRVLHKRALTWHQILKFAIEFLRIIALFRITAVVQFQNDAQHNTASIWDNATSCTFQAQTFGFVMLLPCICLALTIAVVNVLAAGAFEHFTSVKMKREKTQNRGKTRQLTHLRLAGAQAKITSFGAVCWFQDICKWLLLQNAFPFTNDFQRIRFQHLLF